VVNFTGGVGIVPDSDDVYEWSRVIGVYENGVLVDYFTQFENDALPTGSTDVVISGFSVQLSTLQYEQGLGGIGARNLTVGAASEFHQLASGFALTGGLFNSGLTTISAKTAITGVLQNDWLMTVTSYVLLDDVAGRFALTGTGDLRLRDGFLTGNGGQGVITHLVNETRISGHGWIGSDFNHVAFPRDGSPTEITNTEDGEIDADVADKTLVIRPELSEDNPIFNAGLLSASNGGTLAIVGGQGFMAYVTQTASGHITAFAGSVVELTNTVVSGGTLSSVGSGRIQIGDNWSRLQDLTVAAGSNVNIGRTVTLSGTIENHGTFTADNFQNQTKIAAEGVTLTGGGSYVLVGNYGSSTIVADADGAVLTNLNHTIRGWGALQDGRLTVINDGLIAATPDSYSDTDTDTLALVGLAGLQNTGILEASGGAKLAMSFMQGVDNTDGVIRARGDGSVVGLREISISGGTFATTGTGRIVADGFNVWLSDFRTLAGTQMDVTTMTLNGSVENRGNLGMTGFLTIDGTVTLTGGGTLRVNDNYNGSNLVGRNAGAVLNNVDNTISGDGAIGVGVGLFNQAGNLSIINSGVIAADEDPYNATFGLALVELAALTNSGILQAQNGATLTIKNPASGVIENAGGMIRATGAGSVVALVGETVISGGRLVAVNGGSFAFGNVTLDGRTEALTSNLDLNMTSGSITLKGAVVNSGDIATSVGARMFIGADTTLSGGGSITINPTYHYSILPMSGVAGATLINLDNTLGGSGSFGANSGMVLINAAGGEVSANQAGNTLALETGSVITNRGVLSADGGILNIVDNVIGSGRIEVRNGGTVIVDQGTDQAVSIIGAGAETVLLSRRDTAAGGFDFAIKGMGVGDRINLDINVGAGNKAAFSFAGGVGKATLSTPGFLDQGGTPYAIKLVGRYSEGQFELVGGADGTLGFELFKSQNGTRDADRLLAKAAGDRVIGFEGADVLLSGRGNDVLDGSTGTDTADYSRATAGVTVTLATKDQQAVGGGQGQDRLIAIENLTGSSFRDSLTGNDGANLLNGGKGLDTMAGGAGGDTYLIDNAGDRITEDAGQGRDSALVSVSYRLQAGVEVELLAAQNPVGTRSLDLTGNAFAQTIKGNDGDNRIAGGGGQDTVWGYDGADTFVLSSPPDGANALTVRDFNVADDQLELSARAFGLLAGPLDADAFVANKDGVAKDAEDRFIYHTVSGKLYFDADGNDAEAAILIATLSPSLALGEADFTIL